jgi:hypothetical protein
MLITQFRCIVLTRALFLPSTEGCPLGEGLEEEQLGFAEAGRQAARTAGQPVSSWGGQSGSSPGASGRFQLSFSTDGAGGAQGSANGVQEGKNDTSRLSGTRDAAAVVRESEVVQQQVPEVAAAKFLQTHGYMVDDLVGDEPDMAAQRSQWKILLLPVISILQRCLTAVLFGSFHFCYISLTQLGTLIALHASFIGYLLLVRPYASWLLLLSDMLAYLCELTVLAVAVLLQRNPGYILHQQLTHALIACYFFDVAAMVVPELLRYIAMGWAWVQARRAREAQQQQGQTSATVCEVAGSAATHATHDGVVTVLKQHVDGNGAAKAAAAAALKLSGSGAK